MFLFVLCFATHLSFSQKLKDAGQAYEAAQKSGSKSKIGFAAFDLAEAYRRNSNYKQAYQYYLEVDKIAKTIGNTVLQSRANFGLGMVDYVNGRLANAEKKFVAGYKLCVKTSDKKGGGMMTYGRGVVLLKKAKTDKEQQAAIGYLKDALKIANETSMNELAIEATRDLYRFFDKKGRQVSSPKVKKELASQARLYEGMNKTLKKQQQIIGSQKRIVESQQIEIETQEQELQIQEQALRLQKQEIALKEDSLKLQEQEILLQEKALEAESQKSQKYGIAAIAAGSLLLLITLFFLRIRKDKKVIEKEKAKSEELLLNILPKETAEELKLKGSATPRSYDMVTVLFTDFKGFTQMSEKLTPQQIIGELNYCFLAFDEIIARHNLEKIKTIGDAYMCAGGLPIPNTSNAIDAVNAAIEMIDFMQKWKAEKIAKNELYFELRLGINTGAVVAGVVGKSKFAYDIWGDAVNLASRMESSGEPSKINISGITYEFVKHKFRCTYRGKVEAKNKGDVDMYFVEGKL